MASYMSMEEMGNILNSGGGSNSGMTSYGASGSGVSGCCDAVVDPISLLTVIAAIAGLALFLRQGSFINDVKLKVNKFEKINRKLPSKNS